MQIYNYAEATFVIPKLLKNRGWAIVHILILTQIKVKSSSLYFTNVEYIKIKKK